MPDRKTVSRGRRQVEYARDFAARKAKAIQVLQALSDHLAAGGYKTDKDDLTEIGLRLGIVVRVSGPYGGIATPKPAMIAVDVPKDELALLEALRGMPSGARDKLMQALKLKE